MDKKRNLEIVSIGLFATILGGWFLFNSLSHLSFYLKRDLNGTLPPLLILAGIISYLIPLALFIGGIFFLFIKKWAIYLVRTTLVVIFLTGFLPVIGSLSICFIGLPPISFNIVIILELAALYLISRPKVKEQFK